MDTWLKEACDWTGGSRFNLGFPARVNPIHLEACFIEPTIPHPLHTKGVWSHHKLMLEYSITRPVTIGICFNITIIILAIAWAAIVTGFNAATVAVELVPHTTTHF